MFVKPPHLPLESIFLPRGGPQKPSDDLVTHRVSSHTHGESQRIGSSKGGLMYGQGNHRP